MYAAVLITVAWLSVVGGMMWCAEGQVVQIAEARGVMDGGY